MSWYQDKVHVLTPQTQSISPPKMLLPITITNLASPLDEEKIKKALLSLQGIKDVKTDLAKKQVFINFIPAEIPVETIAYTLSKLGYHYIQRS